MERQINGVDTIFHADDFGACREVTEQIMQVFNMGNLDSVSVLPNGRYFDEAIEILKKTPSLKYSIHFNITEGHCLANKDEVNLLVDSRGMFNVSFFKILIKSYLPGRKKLKQQIKEELKAQFNRMIPYMDSLRIDSHQHFHMIPMVLDCILEIVDESNKKIEFLRIPTEPLIPFFTTIGVHEIKPINIVKNLVLNSLALINARKLRQFENKSALFFGMVFSCEMDYERVEKILPKMLKIAKKRGKRLEVLAHPGGCSLVSELMDTDNDLCREFYMSEMRNIEKDMMFRLNKML